MPTLILNLPLTTVAATPEYDYLLSPDGQQVGTQGHAAAALLPAVGRSAETVALVCAQALSWHRATLPERVLRNLLNARLEPARARAVLAGVLEDQLLDEAEALHFAVFAAAPDESGANAWIAACDRVWLQGHLQALEAAGHSVSRLAAEASPAVAGASHALVSGEGQDALLQICDAQGVRVLPLQGAGLAVALADDTLEIRAEPAAMALAQNHFGNHVTLQSRAARMLEAARSPWNLAQLEFTASASGRWAKRLRAGWQQLLHAPQWRPVRWGLVALVVVQVVALNAMAWQQRRSLDGQRDAMQRTLRQTFPDIQLVIDAPAQMQRAVDDLARARGAASDADLSRMLAVLATSAPLTTTATAIDFSGRQMRVKASGLEGGTTPELDAALDSRGLRARAQDGTLLVEPKEQR